MDRESRLFPPDRDDLGKTLRLVSKAEEALRAASENLGKLLKDVAEFPAIGPERAKQTAVQHFRGVAALFSATLQGLEKLKAHTTDLGEDISHAFHDPLQGREHEMAFIAQRVARRFLATEVKPDLTVHVQNSKSILLTAEYKLAVDEGFEARDLATFEKEADRSFDDMAADIGSSITDQDKEYYEDEGSLFSTTRSERKYKAVPGGLILTQSTVLESHDVQIKPEHIDPALTWAKGHANVHRK